MWKILVERNLLASFRPGAWTALAVCGSLMLPSFSAMAEPVASPAAFVDKLQRAEARTAAKDWKTAAALWEEVTVDNPFEGRFWNALATARYGAKQYRPAIAAYQRAVDLGFGTPANDIYNIACSHALLGERERAFAALGRALAMGFLDLELLRTDGDLASIRSDARFARLVPGTVAVGASRIDGWRSDLRFLSWQIARIGVDPYRRKPRSWFDAQFDALSSSTESRTDTQIGLDLLRIMREVGDGHSGVLGRADEDWALTLPVQFGSFPEGVYVVAADAKYRDALGARVLAYDGKPIEEVMGVIAAGVSRDNDGGWVRLQSAYRLRHTALLHALGIATERGGAALKLQDEDGKQRTVRVTADTSQPDIWNQKPSPAAWATLVQTSPGAVPLYLRDPGKPYWFEYLAAERTVYLALNTVRDDPAESLAAFSDRLAKTLADVPAAKLIVDLRWNNGGNTQLLTPLLAAVLRSDKINRRGRLFVLIGPRTFSAGQNAATMLERYTWATFVGEPTGSSPNFIGEEDAFTLPYSKLRVNVSHLAWQSGLPQDKRSWIAPLIHVPATFASYRAKRDPVVELILTAPTAP